MDNKLSIVIPFHNQLSITQQCVEQLNKTTKTNPKLIMINNGSDDVYALSELLTGWREMNFSSAELRPNNDNIGVFGCFKQSLELTDSKIIAFPHSDLLIWEEGWDIRIMESFANDPQLAVIGFIGSWEIDNWGGRGMGTSSNFMGYDRGSKAEIHGSRIGGLMASAVVDGCFMAFRREFLEQIKDITWPPHHFYDRMLCCEAIKRGWRVATLGIQCDHVSGQTANQEKGWHKTAEKWANDNLLIINPQQWADKNKPWLLANFDMHRSHNVSGWDEVIYLEAEKQFLSYWRDGIHFTPFKVNQDYSVQHYSQLYQG